MISLHAHVKIEIRQDKEKLLDPASSDNYDDANNNTYSNNKNNMRMYNANKKKNVSGASARTPLAAISSLKPECQWLHTLVSAQQ